MTWLAGPQRYPLTSFFTLAYAWTWLCWWSAFAISSRHVSLPISKQYLEILGQFGPFVAGFVVTYATGGRAGLREFLSRLVRCRVRPIWIVISLLLLPATMLISIFLVAYFKGTIATLEFHDSWTTLPAHFVYTLVLCGPLGEEPGWRGFALPRMQSQYGPVAASIWLGLLEAGWHLPLWWLFPSPCPFALFVAGAVLLSFLFTWLFNHTHGSVFYSLVFHTSMSVASVRLPEVPAYHLWVVCLSSVVLLILFCHRHLGRSGDEPSSSGAG